MSSEQVFVFKGIIKMKDRPVIHDCQAFQGGYVCYHFDITSYCITVNIFGTYLEMPCHSKSLSMILPAQNL